MARAKGANLTDAERAHAQRVAVAAFARGKTNQEAADLAQVNIRTIVTWKQDPDFRARIEDERARLEENEPEAVKVLRDALQATKGDGIDWTARVRAATELLDQVPSESPANGELTEITILFPAEALEKFTQQRRDDYAEQSARFQARQDEQARQVEKLYASDRPTVPDPPRP